MRYLIILLLLAGCNNGVVPKDINQHVSGNVTTTNIIRIEINIPQTISDAFITTCDKKCKDSIDLTCKDTCNADQVTGYTNTLLGLLNQLQQALAPSPSPTPNP